MKIEELSLKWAEYRFKIKRFEEQKEREFREKYPDLSSGDVSRKVQKSLNRIFKKEAEELLANHLKITK